MSDTNPERSNRDGPSRIDDLRQHIENVMKGFHGSNAIAYKNKNEYVTYSRPADCLKLSSSTDEFVPDNKQFWPVLNNMGAPLPPRLTLRPNRADDPEWNVPAIDKTPIQTFPQSKGLKLRQVDEIINDRQLYSQFAPPHPQHQPQSRSQQPITTTAQENQLRLPSSNSHASKNFEPPLSTVQGVLDIITETSRKPARPSTTQKKASSTTTTTTTNTLAVTSSGASNRPRKSSLLKSEITSDSDKPTPTQVGSKKPMSLLTNNNTDHHPPQHHHPRVSSKSNSVQKNKYEQDIPVRIFY